MNIYLSLTVYEYCYYIRVIATQSKAKYTSFIIYYTFSLEGETLEKQTSFEEKPTTEQKLVLAQQPILYQPQFMSLRVDISKVFVMIFLVNVWDSMVV